MPSSRRATPSSSAAPAVGSKPPTRSIQDPALAYINIGIYGHMGVGKTPLIGTSERAFIMDADNGLESARAAGSKAQFTSVTNYAELQQVYEYFRYGTGCKDYDWVWLDSLSLFMDRTIIDDITKEAHEQNPRQSEDVASQREYLVQQNRISTYVRQFVGLPIHFGWTALVATVEEPETGELVYHPMIPGRKGEFSSKICGYMNVVAYLGRTPKGNPRLITGRLEHYWARDRFAALNTDGKPWIANPTIPKLQILIKEKTGNGQDQDHSGQAGSGGSGQAEGLRSSSPGSVRRRPGRRRGAQDQG